MHRLRSKSPWIALLVATATLGCDGSDSAPDATGEYSGTFAYTVDDQPFQEEWVFSISEDHDGRIQGTGMQGDDFVTIVGMHDHPDIELEFEAANDGYLGRLTGVLSDDGSKIEGTFTLSIIFVAVPVALTRT